MPFTKADAREFTVDPEELARRQLAKSSAEKQARAERKAEEEARKAALVKEQDDRAKLAQEKKAAKEARRAAERESLPTKVSLQIFPCVRSPRTPLLILPF